jgi:hypothetical protein
MGPCQKCGEWSCQCVKSTAGSVGLLVPPGATVQHEASTLRDQFAMVALQGLLSKEGSTADLCFQAFAECAYKYADAMLNAREVKR